MTHSNDDKFVQSNISSQDQGKIHCEIQDNLGTI